jgi:hypothetical protein
MIIDSSAGPAFCDAAVPGEHEDAVPMIDPIPSASGARVRAIGGLAAIGPGPQIDERLLENRPMGKRAATRHGVLHTINLMGWLSASEREAVIGGRLAW